MRATFLALATLAAALTLAILPATRASAAGCAEKRMYFVAHEDDDILFGSPDLLKAIEAGACVRTVFLTAGDAGLGETYWRGREEGSRAAYAHMAGVSDNWTSSEPVVEEHRLHVETLTPEPNLSQVNLRLPDGNIPGEGFLATGFQSLAKLWRSKHSEPASLAPITQIQTVDHSSTYTYEGLLATMKALIAEYEPDVIATQDDRIGFEEGDHSDHVVTARLAQLADASDKAEHVFRSYVDYPTQFMPQNVFGSSLQTKSQTFYIYGAHDPETCSSEAQCNAPPFTEYGAWLKRQYVSEESSIPGADAGSDQSVASEATVTLDGSDSSDPLGQDLDYEWQQTAGTAVTLSNRHAVKPTFTAPAGPASLEFELVVDNGEATSLPAAVKVAVAPPARHQLSVTKAGGGSGSVTSSPAGISCGTTCAAEFEDGAAVSLTANSTAGSRFVKWTGACTGSGACSVTMTAAKSVGAEFALIPKFALKVARSGNGGGTVTSSPAGISCGTGCEAEYEEGTKVTLSASPSSGSEFAGWSGAGCSGTGSCVVTMSVAREVTAQFTLQRHQLSVAKSGSGTITSSPSGISCGTTCAANFDHGTVVTLSANPATGSEFVRWTGACTGSGTCSVTMSTAKSVGAEFALVPKFALKVAKTGNGSGTVTSSPAGIDCGTSCEAEYERGATVTLSANPAAGSEFTGWSGAGCSGTGSCVVTISAAREVSAQFTLQRHQLSVVKSGLGSGSVTSSPSGISCGTTCSASFDHGTVVSLTASPVAGSEFVRWTGACTGSGACSVTMTAAKSVGAEFALVPKFALKVTRSGNGGGTVTSSPAGISCGTGCEAEYERGTQVTLSAAPTPGSEFTGWSGGGCTGTGNCVVTMSAAREVSARFQLQRHQLSVTNTGTGTGSVSSSPAGIACGSSCAAEFDHGTVVSLSATPAAGSEFLGWTGACSGSGACEVTMTAAKSVGAEFAPVPKFALKVAKPGNGSGTVTSSPSGISCGSDCEAELEQGTKVTLSASPSSGSEFAGWSGAGCSGTGSCVVTMSVAREVTAQFTLQRHQLSVAKSGSGTITSSPSGISCGTTCAANFDHGTVVTLSANPATGSEFVRWTGACTGSGTCSVTMSTAKSVGAEFALVPKFALKVAKTGNGSGTVTSSPAGIDCGTSCEAEYERGATVTLSANPAAGSEFTGWSGAGCSGTGSCVVTISAAREVSAQFTLQRHQLSVVKSGLGSGSVTSSPSGISCGTTCSASFDHGTVVSLTASPVAGSEFVRWTGACTGSGACSVTMTAAKSVGAEFALVPKFALKVTRSGNGGGTVTSSPAGISCGTGCEAEYERGTQVTLSAAPTPGSEFTGWSGGGCTGTGNCVVTMSAAREVSARFQLQRHQLSVTNTGTGTGSVSSSPAGIACGSTCAAEFDHGTVVSLSANPAAGSEFVGWTGACTGSGACSVTMTAAKSVAAEFALVPKFALRVTELGSGDGTVTSSPTGIDCGPSCEAEYERGTKVTLSANPSAGSAFTGWSGACSGSGTCEVTMAAAREVSAQFTLQRHQLSVTKEGAGGGTVTSSPSGISCGTTCSTSFDHGTVVTLSATPVPESSFVRWTGACSGSGACEVTMSDTKTVGAEFALIPKFSLKVDKSGNGDGGITGTPAGIDCGASCEAEYLQGTEVTLSADPAAGSEFSGWSGAGCSGTSSCVVTMAAEQEVTAQFVLQRHQLSVAKTGSGSGAVNSSPAGIDCGASCAAEFDHGTVVSLSANPAAGSEFVSWTGACTGSGACSVTMTAAKSVAAEFALVPKFALKIGKAGNGSGTVSSSPPGIDCGSSCEAEYERGTLVSLSATPAPGSEFSGWSGAGCTGTASCEVTVSTAQEVTARFTLQRHQLSVTASGDGSGTIASSPDGIDCGTTCSAEFDHGTAVTLSATRAAGTEAATWSRCDEVTEANECVITLDAARSVEAEFDLVPHYDLTVTKAGNGSGTVTGLPTGIDCGTSCEAGYQAGTAVTLSATPAPGSEFVGWGAACSGTGECEVTIAESTEVTAEFVLQRHQLSVTEAGSGSGNVTSSPSGVDCGATCSAEFDHGTVVSLTATPAADTEAVKWSGCDEVTDGGTCIVEMTAAKEVTATLDRRPVPPDPGPEQKPGPTPTPEPAPESTSPAPTAKLIKVKVDHARGTARFVFRGGGETRAFQCALTRGRQKPKFKRCTSPTTYRRLDPGKYIFKVRAIEASGRLARPLVRKFGIASPFLELRARTSHSARPQPGG